MSFLKKIFDDDIDESVHTQFSRFSKGTFENRAVIEISNSKKVKVKTSGEFVNELVEFMANTMEDKTNVTGVLFSKKDISNDTDIKFQKVKSAMGVKKHIINQELSKEQILKLCKDFSNCSIVLSFETNYGVLKIKEKIPKSGKQGKKKNEAPKADFCTLITENKDILKEYAFDVKDQFKKAKIFHTYIINEIIVPKEYENDFEKARLMATRKGKIIRKLIIDGKEETKEKDFEA